MPHRRGAALRPSFLASICPPARNATDHPFPSRRGAPRHRRHSGPGPSRRGFAPPTVQSPSATKPALRRTHLGCPSRRGFAPPPHQPPSATEPAPRRTHPGHHRAWTADRNDRDDRAATGRATIPLDLNAASVHPIVTIPLALAIARRATPPRLAPRPSHLAPSVGQPAPRRTILFPCRRALPGDRCHRGFHPAEALPRERTGHHRCPGLPRDGTSCFHHAERRPATEPSWLEAELSADRNDPVQSAATGRATIVLDLTAARLQPIVTSPFGSGKSPSPSGRGLRGERLFAASTREPASPRTIRHQHAAGSTTPAPFWAGSPTAALNRHRAVTISDQARPATAPSGLTSHRCFAPPPHRPPSATGPPSPLTYLGRHWALLRTVTTAITQRKRRRKSNHCPETQPPFPLGFIALF